MADEGLCSCGKPFPEDGGAEGVCECCSGCASGRSHSSGASDGEVPVVAEGREQKCICDPALPRPMVDALCVVHGNRAPEPGRDQSPPNHLRTEDVEPKQTCCGGDSEVSLCLNCDQRLSQDYEVHGPKEGVRKDWLWLCDYCGWRGIGCPSEDFARREAEQHLTRDHYGPKP